MSADSIFEAVKSHSIFNGVDWEEVEGVGACVNAKGVGIMTANAAFAQSKNVVEALSFCSHHISEFWGGMHQSNGFTTGQADEFAKAATRYAAERLQVLFGLNAHKGGNA